MEIVAKFPDKDDLVLTSDVPLRPLASAVAIYARWSLTERAREKGAGRTLGARRDVLQGR